MARSTFFIALALFADGLAGLTGGLLSEQWLFRRQAGLVGFAAGALLSAVFLDILPECIRGLNEGALLWAFVGFVGLAIIEWLFGNDHHHHHDEDEHHISRSLPPSLLLSDALHNIGDGVAVAASFLVSTRLGIVVALALIAHEVPQEVGDYVLLRAAKWSRSRALLALAAVQSTAVIGAAGVVIAAGRFETASATFLSLAAGTFLYIGATDLLPELHAGHTSAERRERMVGFLTGIALIVLISFVEHRVIS